MFRAFLLILSTFALLACEQLGLDPAKVEATRQAEGSAVGGACRLSGRALEECYALNKRHSKAAIFSGWRDMDAYMRENNLAIIPPKEKPEEPAEKMDQRAGTTIPGLELGKLQQNIQNPTAEAPQPTQQMQDPGTYNRLPLAQGGGKSI